MSSTLTTGGQSGASVDDGGGGEADVLSDLLSGHVNDAGCSVMLRDSAAVLPLSVQQTNDAETRNSSDAVVVDLTHSDVEAATGSVAGPCSSPAASAADKCVESALNPLTCGVCYRSFTDRASLSTHECAVDTRQRQYACHICRQVFRGCSNLIIHMQLHLRNGRKPHEAGVSRNGFAETGSLDTRVRSRAGELATSDGGSSAAAAAAPLSSHTVSTELRQTGRGEFAPGGGRPHARGACQKRFSADDDPEERQHVDTADKPPQCDVCPEQFSVRRDFVKHKLRHAAERRYVCQVCHKRFADRGKLTRHMRMHSAELLPHRGDVCQQRFSQRRSPRQHRRTHAASQPRSDHETSVDRSSVDTRASEAGVETEIDGDSTDACQETSIDRRSVETLASEASVEMEIDGESTAGAPLSSPNCALSDSQLLALSTCQLNSRLTSLSSDERSRLKQRRRTLKNRRYAASCRERRSVHQHRLIETNDALTAHVSRLEQTVRTLTAERDAYRRRCETYETVLQSFVVRNDSADEK